MYINRQSNALHQNSGEQVSLRGPVAAARIAPAMRFDQSIRLLHRVKTLQNSNMTPHTTLRQSPLHRLSARVQNSQHIKRANRSQIIERNRNAQPPTGRLLKFWNASSFRPRIASLQLLRPHRLANCAPKLLEREPWQKSSPGLSRAIRNRRHVSWSDSRRRLSKPSELATPNSELKSLRSPRRG